MLEQGVRRTLGRSSYGDCVQKIQTVLFSYFFFWQVGFAASPLLFGILNSSTGNGTSLPALYLLPLQLHSCTHVSLVVSRFLFDTTANRAYDFYLPCSLSLWSPDYSSFHFISRAANNFLSSSVQHSSMQAHSCAPVRFTALMQRCIAPLSPALL